MAPRSVMTPGQTYTVSVTMQNVGDTTWTAASLYRLGAQNPQDNSTWGPVRVELPNSVAPGANVTFTFDVTAPGTVGTYNFQWRMVEDLVEWFGSYSDNVAVKDGVNDGAFVSQSVPATMFGRLLRSSQNITTNSAIFQKLGLDTEFFPRSRPSVYTLAIHRGAEHVHPTGSQVGK